VIGFPDLLFFLRSPFPAEIGLPAWARFLGNLAGSFPSLFSELGAFLIGRTSVQNVNPFLSSFNPGNSVGS